MEILLPVVATVLTQAYKWLVGKFGKNNTTVGTYIALLIISIGLTFWQAGTVDLSDYKAVLLLFGTAIAFYEVAVKWLIVNVLGAKKLDV